jgi:hypothetical protein
MLNFIPEKTFLRPLIFIRLYQIFILSKKFLIFLCVKQMKLKRENCLVYQKFVRRGSRLILINLTELLLKIFFVIEIACRDGHL